MSSANLKKTKISPQKALRRLKLNNLGSDTINIRLVKKVVFRQDKERRGALIHQNDLSFL